MLSLSSRESSQAGGELTNSSNSLSPTAISLLSELLRLDWRKRINAIDALKHPYFTTPPLPARPGDIPRFQDSHELDKKKPPQRPPMPPAPAGGSVNTASNGGWASSGSRGPDSRSRIPGAARGARPNAAGPGNLHRGGPFPSRDNGLPPRPPVSARPPWDGSQTGRSDGRDDQRRDRPNQSRPGGRFSNNVDSYIPNYGNPHERARDSSDHNAQSNPEWRNSNRRDYRRDPSRRRSRSPNFRDSGRG